MNSETLLKAVIFFFGLSKKDAKAYIQAASEEAKTELIKGYLGQTEKAFLND